MRRKPHTIPSKGGGAIAERLTRRTHRLSIGLLKRGRSMQRKDRIEEIKTAAGKQTTPAADHLAEAKVALAIAVSLKRETHRPSCSVAQRAAGAMRDHLAEAEVALAIEIFLKRETQ